MANYLRQPTVHRLPQLMEELRSGALRIPPFQRSFEWKGAQRLHLFDSVRRGLPIGALMVWRTTKEFQTDPNLGPIRLDLPGESEGATRQYLLDGRQRMTTLFAGLAPGLWTREPSPVPEGFSDLAPDDAPWSLSFDLERNAFVLGEENDSHLPMRLLLDDFAVDEWLAEHPRTRETYAAVRALKSAFYDYLVPVTPLHTDVLEDVTLTFKRVNRAGTPMGDLAMARALSWTAGGFDLEARIEEILELLGEEQGWSRLSGNTALKVLACIVGLDPAEFDVEKLSSKVRADPSVMDRLEKTLLGVATLLNEMGIAGPATLPYERALVAAARLMVSVPTLPAGQRSKLKGWLAVACMTEAFGNAPPHIQRALHRELVACVESNKRAKRRTARLSRKFSMAWARSRVTAVALASLKPLGPQRRPLFEDAAQAVGERGNDVMCRLITPKAKGIPSQLANEARMASPALLGLASNRVLCDPSKVVQLRQALFGGDSAICTSHAFPIQAPPSLVEFFEQRETLIKIAELQWVDQQLPGLAVRWVQSEPSIATLR